MRLFDIKNIEDGNRRFTCLKRRVNIQPQDRKSEEINMKENLKREYQFSRIVYDAL